MDLTAKIGARMRELRRERGMTLAELGVAAGLSHPFLSQVERGLARPSVASLIRIEAALGVPSGALWSEPTEQQVPSARREEAPAVAHAQGRAGVARILAAPDQPFFVLESIGGSGEYDDAPTATLADVLLYVASGSIEVDVGGDVHELDEGGALIIDGSIPHGVRVTGPPDTRFLYVSRERENQPWLTERLDVNSINT